MGRRVALEFIVSVVVGGGLVAAPALAADTTTFSYDSLGRLVASSVAKTGGATTTRICLDRAGNRLRYEVTTGAPAACAVQGQSLNANSQNATVPADAAATARAPD